MRADCVYLSPAPLYHSAPLRFCMGVHRGGGTVVIMERFDAEEALALIERYQVTTSQWVPTMFVRMLKLARRCGRTLRPVVACEVAVHAAAPCPVEVKRQMIEWWGPILHEYYAGTEGNGFVYCNSDQWLAHPGTVGQPRATASCTSATTTATSCPSARRARSTSRAGRPSSTTTTRTRRPSPATPRVGRRWATSAASTTTATST